MEESHQRILGKVEDEMELDDTGHDVHHLQRVYNLGMKIADEEGGDKDVIGAACLTHDIHRMMGEGGFVSPKETLPRVKEILKAANYNEDKIDDVLYCVEVHEEYDFEDNPNRAESLEAEIVQDADNLDAMGAVGIGRTFKFAGAHGNPMWNPEREYNGESYQKENLSDSTIYHFYEKLLKLKDNMNTETAQKIAEERHRYMENFVDRFKKEWQGEL